MKVLNADEMAQGLEYRKVAKRILFSTTNSTRTELEKNNLNQVIKWLTDHLTDMWYTLVKKDIDEIRVANYEDPNGYADVLLLKVPRVPKSQGGQDRLSLEIILTDLLENHETVRGALQEVGPLVRGMQKRFKRCQDVFKDLIFVSNLWEADAAFETVFPYDVRDKMFRFEVLLDELETLDATYVTTQAEISRIVTLAVAEPHEGHRSTGSWENSQVSKPVLKSFPNIPASRPHNVETSNTTQQKAPMRIPPKPTGTVKKTSFKPTMHKRILPNQ